MSRYLWLVLLCAAPLQHAHAIDDLGFTEDELSNLALAEASKLGGEPFSLGEHDAAASTEQASTKESRRRSRRRRSGNKPTRRRGGAGKPQPLAARVVKLEKQVKELTAWVKKLADKLENGGGDKPNPPDVMKPGVAACKDKEEGETCEFILGGDKDPVKGQCVVSKVGDKKVPWCKPKGKVPPFVAACKDKQEEAECEFTVPKRGKQTGMCVETEKDGKKTMWCKADEKGNDDNSDPDDDDDKPETRRRRGGKGSDKKPPGKPEVPPIVAACKDKEASEECEFTMPKGGKQTGKCKETEKDGKKIMWCDAKGKGGDEKGNDDNDDGKPGRRGKGGSGKR